MAGLVHIYTGNGKGKTTAAIGLGIRASGRGRKVLMVQFLKGAHTGEMIALERFKPDFELCRYKEISKFSWNMTSDELEDMKKTVENLFQYAVKEAESGRRDLIILDEIMAAITSGFIEIEDVISFVMNKPEKLELVMTGRNAPFELVQLSDYVSEISMVKHPLSSGIPAREGIEY
jgi:cob(I)alamin adenosyltransferase